MSEPFNLEEEYGGFVDLLDKYFSELSDDEVTHFGVKGMHWGVRKDNSSGSSPLKSLGPDEVKVRTASGEEVTMSKRPPTALHRLMGRMSSKYREEYASTAFLQIKDSSGKKVGEAEVAKKNADELYLVWLGIDRSSRGRGYATAVMKAAEEFGKKENFKKMTLEVPGNSPDARHIYEKLGFKFIAEVDGGSKDPIWGGLSNMEYTFDAKHGVDHAGGVSMTAHIVDDKPTLDELMHYGVKGMHWGTRKQKELDSLTRISQGKGKVLETLRFKGNLSLVELAANKGDYKRIAAGRAAMLSLQKQRIESGNANKLDKLDRALNTSIIDLVRGT